MDYSAVLVAAGGGFAITLLNFAEAVNLPKDRRPDFQEIVYWVQGAIYPALGAFVAYVYVASGYDIKPVLALQVGASAPLILRAAASAYPRELQPPKPPPGA
jgi:hypothetical protein